MSTVTEVDPAALSHQQLEDALVRLASEIFAAEAQFLRLLAEFDRRGQWGVGVLSAAHWLSWRCGIDLSTARERVRVARSLPALPRTAEAFASGAISYSKVRAMTRVATPDNEEELLSLAQAGTASHLERIVRGYRASTLASAGDAAADAAGCDPGQSGCEPVGGAVREPDESRPRTWRRWREDGMVERVLLLTPDQDAALSATIQAALDLADRPPAESGAESDDPDALPAESDAPVGPDDEPVELASDARRSSRGSAAPGEPHPDVSAETSCAQAVASADGPSPEEKDRRRAEWSRPRGEREIDALLAVADSFLADPRWRDRCAAERYQVVVHVELDALRRGLEPDPDARCADELGEPIPVEVARRLACDCSTRTIIDGEQGQPLDVGRTTRSIPRAIRRALRARDGGCRFPGCTNDRWVEAHHIWHWVDGGPTRLDNLVLLCRRHHAAVHEAGLLIELVEAGAMVVFRHADGTVIEAAPALPGAAVGLHDLLAGAPLRPEALGGWDGGPCDYSTAIEALVAAGRRAASPVAGSPPVAA